MCITMHYINHSNWYVALDTSIRHPWTSMLLDSMYGFFFFFFLFFFLFCNLVFLFFFSLVKCSDDHHLLQALVLFGAHSWLGFLKGAPVWQGSGLLMTLLLHTGPAEMIYYWFHRFLHSAPMFERYHKLHHESVTPEPSTRKLHPLSPIRITPKWMQRNPWAN